MDTSNAYALHLDAADPLKEFRQQFLIPARDGKEQVYFLGNSLGLQPRSTTLHLQKVLDQWHQYGVEGFFDGDDPWMNMHERLATMMSPIVGAKPSEVVIMNQLTVNLHLLMASFYRPSGHRYKILCEAKAFPSDQYMLESLCRHLGRDPADVLIELSPPAGDVVLHTKDVLAAIDKHASSLAMVFLGGVNYYTGELIAMEPIAAHSKAHGLIVGFDLAHAAGNVPLQLHNWDVDFAAWCNYKYLNAGPGAIASAFIHERYHSDTTIPRLAGWWGYDKATRFNMEKGFVPIPSAEGWQVSTPPILLYAALEASLEIFTLACMDKLVNKSTRLYDYLLYLLNALEVEKTSMFTLLTPPGEHAHGAQLSMLFAKNGRKVFEALTHAGIFADWREPNVIRIAPVPLYNRFEEVWRFVQVLDDVLGTDKS